MTIRKTSTDLLSSIFGKPFISLPVAELKLKPVAYHKTLDEIIYCRRLISAPPQRISKNGAAMK